MTPKNAAVEAAGEHLIVVGVDGSACATRAVAFAARQAARYDLPLLVSDAVRQAEALEPTVVVKGERCPGPALARRSKRATGLVVGPRGHSEVVGIFLGSVSQYVLHHAPCNTIVVR